MSALFRHPFVFACLTAQVALAVVIGSPAAVIAVNRSDKRASQEASDKGTLKLSESKSPETVGTGREVHQSADSNLPIMTTQQACPLADLQNSLTGGSRGAVFLEDFVMRDKIFHFDHERIPERVVHARGFGAHGYFEPYLPLPEITKADLFQRAEEKTPVFVRFSILAGNKGSTGVILRLQIDNY